MWSLSLKDGPASEPVDVSAVQMEGRLSSGEAGDQTEKIARNLKTARFNCEQFTGRQLITATWTLKLDSWTDRRLQPRDPSLAIRDRLYEGALASSLLRLGICGSIAIPLPPLQRVNSIKYLDTAGVQQTWDPSNYVVDAPSGPFAPMGRIWLAVGMSWPVIASIPGAIEIEFDAGYGDDALDVPEPLVDGIIMRALEMYDQRGNVITDVRVAVAKLPTASESLWEPFRVGRFGE